MAGVPLIANRYGIRRQLGVGGQGEVYEALDTYEGDVVALKLLTMVGPAGPWVEAQILRRLADPHILPIRNADLASGRPYLVTDLAAHGTLEDAVGAAGACGLGVDEVVRLMRQACHGIARGHDLRLIHNDIKPGNLFLNAEGECLVGDFGLASLIPTGGTLTAPAGATPETAAPEVAAGWSTPGKPTASMQSDVYSLGATAFWLLAGRPPLDLSGAVDTNAKMGLVATLTPPRMRDVAPHVPNYVAVAIERALATAAGNRFASVTDFAAALGQRPGVIRRWRRTDEHSGHISCWRGEPESGGSTYVLCLEQGARTTQANITTRHLSSGKRVTGGSRTVPLRTWAQGVRSSIRALR
jgi:eukaryotic-like serine/threonine-protein kinase